MYTNEEYNWDMGIFEFIRMGYYRDILLHSIVQYLIFGFLEEFEDFIEICSLQ